MTKDESLKMALEAIEFVHDTGDTQTFDMCYAKPALAAIKETLAQTQEPVAGEWIVLSESVGKLKELGWNDDAIHKANTPQRKPLSDEEMKKIWYAMQNIMGWYSFQEIARAIEAAHGIKAKNTRGQA